MRFSVNLNGKSEAGRWYIQSTPQISTDKFTENLNESPFLLYVRCNTGATAIEIIDFIDKYIRDRR